MIKITDINPKVISTGLLLGFTGAIALKVGGHILDSHTTTVTVANYLESKSNDGFDFDNSDKDVKLIEIKDANNNISYHFARSISSDEIANGTLEKDKKYIEFSKDDKLKYTFSTIDTPSKAVSYKQNYYFDINDNKLISVNFYVAKNAIYNPAEVTQADEINTLLLEEDPSSYVSQAVGHKEVYTKADLNVTLKEINQGKVKKLVK